MLRGLVIVGAIVACAGAGWRFWPAPPAPVVATIDATLSPADARQQAILRDAVGKPGDPDLARRFANLNHRHFDNAIPPTPVIWEPRLAEVGALAEKAFTLLGMFGKVGDRTVILLHPDLQQDAEGLDRSLSHEMVHAYLFTLGDESTDHGPAFQAVLRRLSEEGAFVGIPASAADRAALKTWLDEEAARLERERADLERGGADGQSLLDRAVAFRLAQDEFRRQVARYNLMVAYPDGSN